MINFINTELTQSKEIYLQKMQKKCLTDGHSLCPLIAYFNYEIMSDYTGNELNILRKKLVYKSSRKGSKETDYLLGRFAQEFLQNMPLDELLVYQDFVEEYDVNIYDWVMKAVDAPEKYHKIIDDINKSICH